MSLSYPLVGQNAILLHIFHLLSSPPIPPLPLHKNTPRRGVSGDRGRGCGRAPCRRKTPVLLEIPLTSRRDDVVDGWIFETRDALGLVHEGAHEVLSLHLPKERLDGRRVAKRFEFVFRRSPASLEAVQDDELMTSTLVRSIPRKVPCPVGGEKHTGQRHIQKT